MGMLHTPAAELAIALAAAIEEPRSRELVTPTERGVDALEALLAELAAVGSDMSRPSWPTASTAARGARSGGADLTRGSGSACQRSPSWTSTCPSRSKSRPCSVGFTSTTAGQRDPRRSCRTTWVASTAPTPASDIHRLWPNSVTLAPNVRQVSRSSSHQPTFTLPAVFRLIGSESNTTMPAAPNRTSYRAVPGEAAAHEIRSLAVMRSCFPARSKKPFGSVTSPAVGGSWPRPRRRASARR